MISTAMASQVHSFLVGWLFVLVAANLLNGSNSCGLQDTYYVMNDVQYGDSYCVFVEVEPSIIQECSGGCASQYFSQPSAVSSDDSIGPLVERDCTNNKAKFCSITTSDPHDVSVSYLCGTIQNLERALFIGMVHYVYYLALLRECDSSRSECIDAARRNAVSSLRSYTHEFVYWETRTITVTVPTGCGCHTHNVAGQRPVNCFEE